jgi:hypothetical protein
MRHILAVKVALFWAVVLASNAGAQGVALTPRQLIYACWQEGAMNSVLMFQCSGLSVSTADFSSCVGGGFCFGEPPLAEQPLPIGLEVANPLLMPYCGGPTTQPCPVAKLCNYPGTPPCFVAGGCGAWPFPTCQWAFPCGLPGNLPCANVQSPPMPGVPVGIGPGAPGGASFGQMEIQPDLQVNLPMQDNTPVSSGVTETGIQVAVPAIPDLDVTIHCRDTSEGEDQFYACLEEQALPPEYRLVKQCLDQNSDDMVDAYFCSIHDEQKARAYKELKAVRDCSQKPTNDEIEQCLETPFLSPQQQYYLGCVRQNEGDLASMAVCGLSDRLNPEQAVALSCAVSTGGQPQLFVACAGGRIAAIEVGKCWKGGIAVEGGCFGPNSEVRKLFRGLDSPARRAMGENSEAYKAFSKVEDLANPGPNSVVVKFINNGIDDMRDGPGPNNDVVKIVNGVGGGLKSVSRVIKHPFGHH